MIIIINIGKKIFSSEYRIIHDHEDKRQAQMLSGREILKEPSLDQNNIEIVQQDVASACPCYEIWAPQDNFSRRENEGNE